MLSKPKDETRQNLIEVWNNLSLKNPSFLKLSKVFWNTPERHLTIVTEHSQGGTLKDWLSQNSGLPELNLRGVSVSLMEALMGLHHENHVHGDLSSEFVFLNSKGEAKLSLNLFKTNFPQNDHKSYFRKLSTVATPSQRAKEVYDFGMLLLEAFLGDLSLVDDQLECKCSKRCCCIIHCSH